MQNFEIKSQEIKTQFESLKKANPSAFAQKLTLSWSVWMFGIEAFADTVKRLKNNDIHYVELKGDRHTKDSGLPISEIKAVLKDFDMKVSGVCGMFSDENDLSSPSVYSLQNAKDYIARQVETVAELGGVYMVVVPSAVGRPVPNDDNEFIRSTAALRACARVFNEFGVCAAIEPIRAAEVSLINSVGGAISLIEAVDEDAIAHVNADTYHMMLEEAHIGDAMLQAGDRLVNLHIADSNRGAPGSGMIDFDTVIRAAYLIEMNTQGRFVTPEPLGPCPNPYVLANSPCNVPVMDQLVQDTCSYFRQREEEIRK